VPDTAKRPRGRLPWHWHVARWREADPGRRGLVWLGLLTVVLGVPLERLGADIAWSTQIRIGLNVGVLLAAVGVGRDAALPDDVERWLVHQGYSPADWVLARWSANLVPLTAVCVAWSLVVALVTMAIGQGPDWGSIGGLAVQLAVSAALLTLVMLVAGAGGVRQTSETLLLVLILTLLLPLARERLPAVLFQGLGLILPPLGAIATLRDGIVHGEWTDAARAALRIATWAFVALAAALALAHRRVPERPSRAAEAGG
jgi:hypothetical protein